MKRLCWSVNPRTVAILLVSGRFPPAAILAVGVPSASFFILMGQTDRPNHRIRTVCPGYLQ